MRITLVAQWFPPEPVDLPLSIAQALEDRGHEVQVLTGIPNYPDGRVAPGYHAWKPMRERIGGLIVQRSPLVPSHSRSAIGRVANYLSWAVTSAIVGLRLTRATDVTVVYSSPATAALGPMIWKAILGLPYILLIEDLWPDSVLSSGMLKSRWARVAERAISWFVDRTYAKASHVVATSPGMIDVLEARGVPPSKLSLIYNWSPVEQLLPIESHARQTLDISEDAFVLTYAGNLGAVQGLDVVLKAVARVAFPVTLLMVGDGVQADELRTQAKVLGLTNARFLGRLGREEMPAVQGATDVHLVSLIADPLFEITMPSKIQSILASAKPFIVMGSGDVVRVAETSGAGWHVPAGDAEGLAAAIEDAHHSGRDALTQKGELGKAFYGRTMSRQVGAERLDALIRQASHEGRESHR